MTRDRRDANSGLCLEDEEPVKAPTKELCQGTVQGGTWVLER